jgi:L-threonylcarbamoyladenylate synthase
MLVEAGEGKKQAELASRLYLEAVAFSHEKVGVMLPYGLPGEHSAAESKDHFEDIAEIFWWGQWSNPEELAQRLFAGLRALDAAGCTIIFCPVPPERGIGAAIRDRLRKAAWPDAAGA